MRCGSRAEIPNDPFTKMSGNHSPESSMAFCYGRFPQMLVLRAFGLLQTAYEGPWNLGVFLPVFQMQAPVARTDLMALADLSSRMLLNSSPVRQLTISPSNSIIFLGQTSR